MKINLQYMKNTPLADEIKLVLSHPLHAEMLYKAVKKNNKYLSKFLPWVESMKTVADFENYLIKCSNEQQLGTNWSFNIFKKNRIIGRIDLHQIDNNNKNACIGYWLSQKEQGKGIITNATKELIEYAFESLQLNRIEILIATHNTKSIDIPLRLGFQKEGILRQVERHKERYFDLAVFSLLKTEWNKVDKK